MTEEFVQVAESLTRRTKLEGLVEFRQGSALQMPFAAGSFDRAYMLHVGMNIADKEGVFREVRRVLKPGGLFAVYDIMRTGEGAIRFPVPWAQSEETSFVAPVQEYREALRKAGFEIEKERRRRAFSIEITERMMARMKQGGPPVLGIHLLLGEQAPVMAGNILGVMKDGTLEPVELYARAK